MMLLSLGDVIEIAADRDTCITIRALPVFLASLTCFHECFSSFHRRLHNEEKGHGCEYCGKHFQDSMRLRMHMLSHTGT